MSNVGEEHVIRISTDEDGRNMDVLHPEGCPIEDDGRLRQYNCAIAIVIAEFGFGYLGEDIADGLYLAQFWATPPGWAGANPVDADAGIELARLLEVVA